MATKSRYARNGNRRRKLRARLKALGNPCAICGMPIDYSLSAGDPMSFEVDEIIPVSLGGDELDWNNLQAVHRICNEKKRKQDRLYPRNAKRKEQSIVWQARRNLNFSRLETLRQRGWGMAPRVPPRASPLALSQFTPVNFFIRVRQKNVWPYLVFC